MTSAQQQVDLGTQLDLVRRAWYAHDARWFAAVAQECGIDVANRLNRQAVRAVARGEMRRLMQAIGAGPPADLEGALALLDRGRQLYVPPSLMDVEIAPVGPKAYTIAFRRCFVHENVTRAGIASAYECAVFQRIEGWHEAWELPLANELFTGPCAMAQGRECRQLMAIR